ncbi:TadG family pilus assembly protein [Methylobacterium durans]|uniref:TadG family pilus assembly protein n=1 Tax=Methylobacterium durans TaxID=2202825 RepID=UPI002AFF16FB|nr:TadG family pilus assembly protein [Methylobacterium durans]MEA1834271.1 TadG family pilus assembly protein [Methylobacterium durans]
MTRLPAIRDCRGSVALVTAFGFAGLLAAGALGIDAAALFQAQRRAQGAVDLAAILAAAKPADAETVARQSLAANGYRAATDITVQSGRYVGDRSAAVARRFTAATAQTNAVRVDLRTSARTTFARALGLPAAFAIRTSGTAATAQFASFSVGSGLASLDAGIVNAVLGAMLGTTLSLSVADYNALTSARIDAFRFLDALATELNIEAATYTDVVRAQATLGQILSGLRVVAGSLEDGAAASALAKVSRSVRAGGNAFAVGRVVDLGDAAALSPGRGSRGPDLGLMPILSAAASIANGAQQVAVDLGAGVPGLLRTRVTLALGEPRQSSGWVEPGSANATVRTAQIRLLIEASLTAPRGLAELTIPLYAEAAQATASLRSVVCPWTDAGQRRVDLDARPGVLDLAIAEVAKSALDPRTAAPDLTAPATILSALTLATVKGRARATVGTPFAQAVTFSDADIANRVIRTVSSQQMVHSAVGSLLASLDLDVRALGLGVSTPDLQRGIRAALTDAAPILDQVLDNVLRTFGIRVGRADLSVDGVRCDRAVLVQ